MKSKLLLILIIFIVIINIFIGSSFAINVVYKDKSYTLPDLPAWTSKYEYLAIWNANFLSGGSYANPRYYIYGYKSNKVYKNGFLTGSRSECDVEDESIVWSSELYGTTWNALDYTDIVPIWSNFDMLDKDGNVIFKANSIQYPYFITKQEDLEDGSFDVIEINSGDFNYEGNYNFYLFSYYYNENGEIDNIFPRKEILLNGPSSNYFVSASNLKLIYEVPYSDLGISIKEGNKYGFKLAIKDDEGNVIKYSDSIVFTVGVVSDLDKQLNSDKETQGKLDEQNKKLDEQNEKLEEGNKNTKGIWDSLLGILDLLNPFSENFFVYKLIDLLGDLIKGLLVPSDDFLSNWFTEVSDYFEDAFGILYYPIDLVIQVLGRFDNISPENPVISFGDFKLYNAVLIPAFTYNFNDILSNDTLKSIHDFYLITIDVILWLGLLVYCKNVCTNIFGGRFIDDVVDDVTADERSYSNYSRYQENKKRYNKENGGKSK